MAVTSVYNANYTPAAIGTEYTLFTSSAAGVYVMAASIPSAFVNGEVVEFRIYSVINGATEQLAYSAVYAHQQGASSTGGVKYSVPVPTPTAGDTLKFTLKQVAGTARTFPVRIMTVG